MCFISVAVERENKINRIVGNRTAINLEGMLARLQSEICVFFSAFGEISSRMKIWNIMTVDVQKQFSKLI